MVYRVGTGGDGRLRGKCCSLVVFNGIEVRFLMALVQWCSCFLFSSAIRGGGWRTAAIWWSCASWLFFENVRIPYLPLYESI